ncbi:hypothetical protein J3B02_003091 [Coemansia erecta]|uniref:Thioredoxin n=1 Tax=Coemansia asiatica TaxID=1052880 RepID=A0A9W7XSA4_9FUNG|nr:hypothetical protein LPJ64_000293 [Coemansia asiatica]KAJ2853554.1 hypothetical protein J3B02_003091 [Coemansia erecta]
MDSTIEIKSVEQFDKLLKEYSKIAIDFKAVWCGPCKLISPVFKKLATEQADLVKADSTKEKELAFLIVDVDELGELAQRFEITAMPTFKFLLNGEPFGELIGADKNALKAKVDALKAADAAPAETA